jgi:hypothetical protein
LTYFHHTLSWKAKQGVTDFKKVFAKLEPEQQSRLICLNLIKMSWYWKSRMLWAKVTSNNLLVRKVKKVDSIYEFIQSIKYDSALSQRVLGCFPNVIHQIYLEEREEARK